MITSPLNSNCHSVQVSIWCGFSSLWFFSSKIRQAGAVLRAHQAAKVLVTIWRVSWKKPEGIGLWGESWRRKVLLSSHGSWRHSCTKTRLICYFLMKYSFPGTQKHIGLRCGGKGKQTDFFAFSPWALSWKGETQIWVGMGASSIFLSSLMYIPVVQYSPAKFSYADWTVRFHMSACVIFGSPSTRRGLVREWVQSSSCGHCAIQRGRKWAFLPKQTSGPPQSDCQEITGWVGVMKT